MQMRCWGQIMSLLFDARLVNGVTMMGCIDRIDVWMDVR